MSREGEYDIIVLDLMLPRDSSLLVLHEIRESDREVDILILSNQDQVHDRVTALIQGADDYLVKPFSFDELHSRIQDLLRHKFSSSSFAAPLDDSGTPSSEHTNRLIRNLLENCSCEHGPIELVISEVKAQDLLQKVAGEVTESMRRKDLRIRQPQVKMPTLLVDAGLMQHLLVKLLANAIYRCPAGVEIEIDLERDSDHCSISIESPLTQPVSKLELKKMFRDFCRRGDDTGSDQTVASLSLARNYAERMNFELRASLRPPGRFRLCLSNIKII